jgi:F-type H+-transporting ATPase subunit O
MLSSRVARAGLRASTPISRSVAFGGIRTYAAAAQDVRPPVALYGIDGTYANALVSDSPQ